MLNSKTSDQYKDTYYNSNTLQTVKCSDYVFCSLCPVCLHCQKFMNQLNPGVVDMSGKIILTANE